MTILDVKESFVNFHPEQICTHSVEVDLRPLDILTTYTVETITADGQVYTPPQSYQFNGFAQADNFRSWLSSIFGDATVTENANSFSVIIVNSTFGEIIINGTYADIGAQDWTMDASCEIYEPVVNPCNEATDDCLPVVSLLDILWQTFVVDLSEDEKVAIDEPNGTEIKFYAKVCTDCSDNNSDNMNFSFDTKVFQGINITGPFSDGFSNGFATVYTGWNAVLTATLLDAALNFNDVADGACFYLCLWKRVRDTNTEEIVWNKIGCSNCFYKTDDECYTSIFRAHMKEVSMGFYNDGSGAFDNYYNSIRLAMYAHSPVPKTKKAVYIKSSGDVIKLSARMQQVYEVETDHLHKNVHFKLATQLEYDKLKFTNAKAELADDPVGFDDEYKLDWNAPDYETGQAKFNIINITFNEVNTNCRT